MSLSTKWFWECKFQKSPKVPTWQFEFHENPLQRHIPLPGIVNGDSTEGTFEQSSGTGRADKVATGLTGCDAVVQGLQTHAALWDRCYQLFTVGATFRLSLAVETCREIEKKYEYSDWSNYVCRYTTVISVVLNRRPLDYKTIALCIKSINATRSVGIEKWWKKVRFKTLSRLLRPQFYLEFEDVNRPFHQCLFLSFGNSIRLV